jgi:hypothetical protein
MSWIMVAAVGLVVSITLAFWKDMVAWANEHIAGWLAKLFGDEVKEAFLLLLAGVDRSVIILRRALDAVQARLIRARILFIELRGGREHRKVVKAELLQNDGSVIELEAAEVVPWHELPDGVREKFIRRQSASVEMELKFKE